MIRVDFASSCAGPAFKLAFLNANLGSTGRPKPLPDLEEVGFTVGPLTTRLPTWGETTDGGVGGKRLEILESPPGAAVPVKIGVGFGGTGGGGGGRATAGGGSVGLAVRLPLWTYLPPPARFIGWMPAPSGTMSMPTCLARAATAVTLLAGAPAAVVPPAVVAGATDGVLSGVGAATGAAAAPARCWPSRRRALASAGSASAAWASSASLRFFFLLFLAAGVGCCCCCCSGALRLRLGMENGSSCGLSSAAPPAAGSGSGAPADCSARLNAQCSTTAR